jgi:hypothetical protein
MRQRLLIVVAALVVMGVAAYVLWPQTRPTTRSQHNEEIDRQYGPILAMLKAPEGKTPCETAHNGFKAFEDAANPHGMPRRWGPLPDRGMFLKRCGALSEQEQLCLQPRYPPRNRGTCEAMLDRLFRSNAVFDASPASQSGPASAPASAPEPPAAH